MSNNQLFSLFDNNWFMSLTMIFGSFIAGATSEGGGAVAFPIMTLVFKIKPLVARDFSLMIQTIGMGMASLIIFSLNIKILKKTIFLSTLFGALGMLFSFLIINDQVSPIFLKIFFTSLWLSFAFVLFKNNRHRIDKTHINYENKLTLPIIAFIGGVISSLLGTGIDILVFSYLTLRHNVNLKIATPTSVVIMAIISAIGFFLKKILPSQSISTEAFHYFLVCIPVVIIGAPFGSYFINLKTQNFIKYLLIITLFIQYLYALFILELNYLHYTFSFFTIIIGFISFYNLSAKKKDLN